MMNFFFVVQLSKTIGNGLTTTVNSTMSLQKYGVWEIHTPIRSKNFEYDYDYCFWTDNNTQFYTDYKNERVRFFKFSKYIKLNNTGGHMCVVYVWESERWETSVTFLGT